MINTIKTIITEKDFESLRNGIQLRFKNKEKDIEIVVVYLKINKK